MSTCGWNPPDRGHMGPLWERLLHILDDGARHPRAEVVDTIHPGSGVKRGTIERLINDAARHGRIEKSGRRSKSGRDTRTLVLMDRVIPHDCRLAQPPA